MSMGIEHNIILLIELTQNMGVEQFSRLLF